MTEYAEDSEEYYYEQEGSQFSPSDANIAGEIDDQGHLQAENLYGVQTKIFSMKITGSLEELASNSSKCTWRMSTDMQNALRQVTSNTNRSKASDADMTGDLGRAILLHASIIEGRNDFPVPIGVTVPEMVPIVHTDSNRYTWELSAHTTTTSINQSVFEPNNIFTEYMYDKYQKLDVESLKEQFNFDVDKNQEFALVNHRGFGWDVIMKNLYKGKFPDAQDYLIQEEQRLQSDPHALGARVPIDIARDVYEAIEAPLKEVEKSFVDLRKIHAKFERSDGEYWNSFTGLVGEAAGLDADSKGFLKEYELATPHTASVKMLVKYIVY